MYVMYYAPMLWCWQLIRFLIKTNHPCLRVGHHSWYQRICLDAHIRIVVVLIGGKLTGIYFL
jgi:hypothetical protein